MTFAIYDLHYCPESFDFFTFLCTAKTLDKNVIVIFVEGSKRKFKETERLQRFDNILCAGCEITQTPYHVVKHWTGEAIHPTKADSENTYFHGALVKAYRDKERFHYLIPIIEKGKENVVTITIRDSKRNEYKNSNRKQWKIVRSELEKNYDVVWIDDWSRKKISLAQRVRFYQSAKINLMIGHGPSVLCYYSELPYLIVNRVSQGSASKEHFDAIGFPVGSQYPWKTSSQELIWGDDRADVILEHFYKVIGK